MQFDTAQKAAYLADLNTAVSAGAGSGKTTVLAERYVRLVTERGCKVHEVLTLTFTRKAASEMRERIFKRLTQSSHPSAKEALTQFDKARISTLDSFCAGLARGASNRYGLSGDFRVDDTEMRRMAEETAVELVMNVRRDKTLYAALSRLVSARTFEIVIKDLFADIALSSFSLVKNGAYAALAQKQTAYIQKETQKRCEAVNNCCDSILSVDDSKSKSETPQKARAAARQTFTLPLTFDEKTIRTLVEKADFFASKEAFPTIKSNVKDETLQELKVLTDEAREHARNLQVLTKTLLFQEDIPAIGRLLDEYEADYLSRKRQMGIVSFRDTLEMAIDILKSDIKLRCFYKKNIKAIMIDEFQDNNEAQKNLLYLLAERDEVNTVNAVPAAKDLAPDKLFFVGDEKQSIYRFRGADVGVFRRLSAELRQGLSADGAPSAGEGAADAAVSLNTNYRSAPELADFFNAVFPSVFGVPTEAYEAAFTPVQSAPSKARLLETPVEIFLQEKTDGEGLVPAETAEALAAAERIARGVGAGEFGFGDVAVLFKSTSRQNEYERVFRQTGIPFTASDPRGVYAEGPANDFYSILRLALFPLDKNAYAGVLRSPFVSLDDEAVFTLLLEAGAEASIDKAPFPQTPALSLNPAEKARYEHGRAVFGELCSRIDREPLASLLSYLWFETGYRTRLLYHKESRPALGHFDYLYTLALDADRRQLSAGAFLDELAPRIGTAEKTETGDAPEVENEVLFLTVHKSKGLEFPVVLLADAGGAGMGDRNDKPYYLSAEWGPVVNLKTDTGRRKEPAVNYFYEMARETIRKQEEAEIKRQFYVAATRAEKRLLIFGTRRLGKREEEALEGLDEAERLSALAALPRISGKGETQKKSFLDLLALGLAAGASGQHAVFPVYAPAYAEYRGLVQRIRETVEADRADGGRAGQCQPHIEPAAFYAQECPCLPPRSVLETTPTALEQTNPGGWARAERLPVFKNSDFLEKGEKGGERALAFGTLCHRLIEKKLGAALFDGTALREARLLFPDASRERAAALADEALGLADAFLASPLGREALASARRAAEFEFLLPLHGGSRTVIVRGKIDLVYEYGGECVIIDFKTDREICPENHRFQLACYRAAAGAFSGLSPRTALVYLRNMAAVSFVPAVSEAQLFSAAVEAINLKTIRDE